MIQFNDQINVIGLTIEEARQQCSNIRVVSVNGENLHVDKKFQQKRRNVKIVNNIIVSENQNG
jgi:hypothetical protein